MRCTYEVIDRSDRYALHPRSCSREATRGAYCTVHATKVERRNAENAKYGLPPFDPNHKPRIDP